MKAKKIDVNQIPEYQKNQISEFALSVVANCFAIPGMEEKYQKWLAERKRKEAANGV